MKITRTPRDIEEKELERQKANEGCDICPCCGEDKSWDFSLEKGETGIYHSTDTRLKGGFFSRYYTVDMYECSKCGTKWESEPYNYR